MDWVLFICWLIICIIIFLNDIQHCKREEKYLNEITKLNLDNITLKTLLEISDGLNKSLSEEINNLLEEQTKQEAERLKRRTKAKAKKEGIKKVNDKDKLDNPKRKVTKKNGRN